MFGINYYTVAHKGLRSPPRSMTPRQIRQCKHRSWGIYTRWWRLPQPNYGAKADTDKHLTLRYLVYFLQGNMEEWGARMSVRGTETSN